MASTMAKRAAELEGLEYDWLGCDSVGHVALFSTAGVGPAPEAFLCDTDAHDLAIQRILALPATTEARFFPPVAAGHVNTWRLVAERGLYAYDCDPSGGPYRLVAAPLVAVEVDALPPDVGKVAAKVRCAGQFEGQSVMTEGNLGWGRTDPLARPGRGNDQVKADEER